MNVKWQGNPHTSKRLITTKKFFKRGTLKKNSALKKIKFEQVFEKVIFIEFLFLKVGGWFWY